MDIFLRDPNEVRLPPEHVRLSKVQATAQPGGRQVKVYLELTPFLKRPNISVTITSVAGNEVAQITILETMLPKLEFTLHLRDANPGGKYTMETKVYYQKLPEPTDVPVEIPLPEPMVVDHNKSTLVIPAAEA